ncbi:MAG: NAD(P)-dependent oxidoreductase [Bacteroidetes bacterium]|nr:MAG: NAD(P)-dependent oxidoreductase [Bacteroidota bacterium]
MKKILIVGASGFIGGFLVEEALNRGYEVYAGIRSTSNRQYLSDKRIKFLELKLSDKSNLKQKIKDFGRFDYVIHNAGLTKSCKKSAFEQVNFQYTKNLTEAFIETENIPDKFIYVSSLDAFGSGNEETMQAIKLSDKPNPQTLYGKSKLKTESYLNSLNGFPNIIIRPTGVYGPRDKGYYLVYKSIKNGIETYIGSRKQVISFIYVKDLARLVFDAAQSEISNKAYFISDLRKYTTEEFNQIVKKELNKKALRIVFPKAVVKILSFIIGNLSCLFGKPATLNMEKYKIISAGNWYCDSSDIVKDFGFKPEYDLKKGIKETITWFKEQKLL